MKIGVIGQGFVGSAITSTFSKTYDILTYDKFKSNITNSNIAHFITPFIMTRVNGVVSFQGTYEDMTFYKKEGKNYVRKKSGVSKERIANDPNYVRTRENMNEFSLNISSGKMLRLSLGSLVFKAKDARLSNRLMQTMSKIKNLDSTSARGERSVSNGIATAEGKQYLIGFDFNSNAPLDSVLFANYTLDTATGEIAIASIIPADQLRFPEGATNVVFQCGVLNIDFATGLTDLVLSPPNNLLLNVTQSSISMIPASMPTGAGVTVYLFIVTFFQEINGVQYSLKNEEYNVLHIVDVI
jgi:hypothetical protein